jgi:hypothetical protein
VNSEQRAAYVVEFEKRFRERTPAKTVDEALPAFRVGRGEMRRWVQDTFQVEVEFEDLEPLNKLLVPVFRRLRREFPDPLW